VCCVPVQPLEVVLLLNLQLALLGIHLLLLVMCRGSFSIGHSIDKARHVAKNHALTGKKKLSADRHSTSNVASVCASEWRAQEATSNTFREGTMSKCCTGKTVYWAKRLFCSDWGENPAGQHRILRQHQQKNQKICHLRMMNTTSIHAQVIKKGAQMSPCQQMSHYRPPETPNTGTCTTFEVCDDWICAAILDARKHAHALKCLLCSGILSTMSDMPSE